MLLRFPFQVTVLLSSGFFSKKINNLTAEKGRFFVIVVIDEQHLDESFFISALAFLIPIEPNLLNLVQLFLEISIGVLLSERVNNLGE